MDTVEQGRRQRRNYYLAILASFALAVPFAIVSKWLTGAIGVEPPTRGIVVAAVTGVPVVVGVIGSIMRFLRCPKCGAGDVLLAYYRPNTRRCERCGAELA
jgi:hypothetical protein